MRLHVASLLVVGWMLAGCGAGVSPHVTVDPALASLAPADTSLMVGVRQVPLSEGATLVLEADKVLTY